MSYRSIISLMPKAAPVDADAQAFLTAAGITDPTISGAINTLVVQMKADNIWNKMKAIYPMVGGSASTHKWNLKDPRDLDAAFRLQFFGGVTHNSNGVLGNGINGYANTFYNPSINGLLNSAHLSYYSRTQIVGTEIDFGGYHPTSNCGNYLAYNYSGNFYNSINDDNAIFGSGLATTTGFLIGSRPNSTTSKHYQNNSIVKSQTKNSVINPNFNLFLGCGNWVGAPLLFSTKQCAFASIGDGLTDTDAANLYTAVQAFQTTLARQI